jgi:hypothetical protein
VCDWFASGVHRVVRISSAKSDGLDRRGRRAERRFWRC